MEKCSPKKGKEEICGVIVYVEKKTDKWYVDSSCSRHMTGDQSNFISIKEIDGGKLNFGNNAFAKIIGKGMITINYGRTIEKDVLYIEGLNHNILSVIQICDQVFDVVFNSKLHEIQNSNIFKLVAKVIRTDN